MVMDALESYLSAHQAELPENDSRLLREVAYERLKDALRHASLQPGEPLSENRISKALGISRTPVREALQMLSQEGLVEIIPGRAVFVASRSFREVLDVLYMRLLLEPELVRMVAETISAEQLDIMWDCLDRMDTAVDQEDRSAWSKADTVWHETLSDACPNRLLGEMVLQMRNRIHRYSNVDNQLKIEQLRLGTAEHRHIVEQIARRDAENAALAMRQHLESLRSNLFSQLIYA
ncbi:MAG: GntR family transcriptional regulator [Chloroflexi bacterium]|nr:GntR family transcriptional regulator [Chloroflexota bacterium]